MPATAVLVIAPSLRDLTDALRQRWLLTGFVLLYLAHFADHVFTVIAGYELMVCAGPALYGMAHAVFLDVFGRDVLPMGKPILH